MAAANEAMDNTVRDFQKLKTSLHRQMVDVIDFHKAEELTESELREQLRSLADYLCTQQSLSLDTQQRETMVSEIMDEIYGFGPIESLMVDPQVTDILINGPDRVLVERKGLLESTNIRFADADHLMRFIHRLVGRAGRRIDESSPIVDARLPDGSRFNAVIPPLAALWSDCFHSSVRPSPTADGRYDQPWILGARPWPTFDSGDSGA